MLPRPAPKPPFAIAMSDAAHNARTPDDDVLDLSRRGAHRLCVAPLMDWTDRHFRRLLRGIGPELVLYTEMITARAIVHGDAEGLLAFDPDEHPVALQLGGNEPDVLAAAARAGADAGYREINLNVGCPSERVAAGAFGAALMAHPQLVADCVAAMRDAVEVPVTVKCRLGIREGDDARFATAQWFDGFVDTVADAGCRLFIVHARDAVLGGLTPRQNREIPPLRPEEVVSLARRRSDLEIVTNGGITTAEDAVARCAEVDGVMVGRAAIERTLALSEMRCALFEDAAPVTAEALVLRWLPYVREELAAGVPLSRFTRLLSGVLHGRPGARRARRRLAEGARSADAALIERALADLGPEAAAA